MFKRFRRRPSITVQVMPFPINPEELDAMRATALKGIDDHIDEFVGIFADRLATGDNFDEIMHDLGHYLIDNPDEWSREGLAMIALRAIHRLATTGASDAPN